MTFTEEQRLFFFTGFTAAMRRHNDIVLSIDDTVNGIDIIAEALQQEWELWCDECTKNPDYVRMLITGTETTENDQND